MRSWVLSVGVPRICAVMGGSSGHGSVGDSDCGSWRKDRRGGVPLRSSPLAARRRVPRLWGDCPVGMYS